MQWSKKKLSRKLKRTKQFPVIVGETIRCSEKRANVICSEIFLRLRYLNGVVHESILEFEVADNLDAAALSEEIICFLEKHRLEYRKNLVGQGYDGTAVMCGAHAGVQAKIKKVAKHAFFVHCSAHCLNLVIVNAVKSVTDAGNFFSLLE